MKKHPYLFSIDLEDIRFRMPNGNSFSERVPETTISYLDWLRRNQYKCTFFTVGDVARAYPDLIRQIIAEGHEIGAHTNTHLPVCKMTEEEFESDINNNLQSLYKAGAENVVGFRAPYFSLTKDVPWAYDVLKRTGFTYSSSVFPASNPFYGWKGFGQEIKRLDSGMIEFPMSIKTYGPLKLAFSGGIYFRTLPKFVINSNFNTFKNKEIPLTGYFHPYDIDTKQEKFMHPEINDNPFFNWLINFNRKNVFSRLDAILEKGFYIDTYKNFLSDHERP